MPDAVFFDVLPRFDWAASEAGQRRLVGQFDTAAKQISRTFGVEAGNAAKASVDRISLDMRRMQEDVARATTTSTENYRRMILAQGELDRSTLRVVEVTERHGFESSQAASALAKQEAATIGVTNAQRAQVASASELAGANAALAAKQAEHQRALDGTAASTAAVGAALNTTGMLAAGTAAVVVGATGKMAADFETHTTRLVTSAGESEQGMRQISEGILKMAGDVGYTANTLADAMYGVSQGGYDAAHGGLDVLKAAAQGARIEGASLDEVINGLTTSIHDFGYRGDQAADVMSKMKVASGAAKGDFQSFASSLHSVEPIAAAAGIALEDVYGVLAQMSLSGMSFDQATQNMRNAIEHLQKPTNVQADAMAKFGINVLDVQQKLGERGLSGTMQYLADTLRNQLDPAGNISVSTFYENAQAAQNATAMMTQMSPAAREVAEAYRNGTISRKDFTGAIKAANSQDAAQLQQWSALQTKLDGFSKQYKNGRALVETYGQALSEVTGTVAGQTVALQITGEKADETNALIDKLRKTTRDGNGDVQGFSRSQETMNAKLDAAKASASAAGVELGNTFLPTLKTMADVLANVAHWLGEHKTAVEALTWSVAALGTAWAGVKIAMGAKAVWDAVVTGLGAVRTAVTTTAASYDTLAAKAKTAAIVMAAIAAGDFVADQVQKIPAVRDRFQNADGTMKNSFDQWIVDNDIPILSMFEPDGAQKSQAARDRDNPPTTPADPNAPSIFGPAVGGPGGAPQQPVDVVNTAAAAVAPTVPDLGVPGGGGSLMPSSTGGSGGSDATATGPNIKTDAPFYAIDTNPANMPAGADYDSWISGQKAVQTARDRVTDTSNDVAKSQARLDELIKKGTATQQEWNTASEAASKARRENQQAIQDVTIAERKSVTGLSKKSRTGESDSGMGETGTSILTGDLEFTPGGIAKYFTALITNLAVGNPVGQGLAAKGDASNPLYVIDASAGGGGLFGGGYGGGGGGPRQAYGLAGGSNSGGYGGSGVQFPDWVNQVGAYFNLKPSTYSGHQETDRHEAGYAPNPNHENRGIDWTGAPQDMQRFADYLKTVPGMEQVIWNGAGQGTGDTVEIAGGRSQPGYFAGDLAGHGNHVHTRQSESIPLPGGIGGMADAVASGMTQWSADWNAIAQKESGGNWGINTGNGYQGGLQFSPSSWLAAGGGKYAPSADQASPYQQAMTAEELLRQQGPGAWPKTFTPGSSGPSAPGYTMGTDVAKSAVAAARDDGEPVSGPLPTGSSILEQLQSEFTGGGGEGPVFKKSPARDPAPRPPGPITPVSPPAGISGAGLGQVGPFALPTQLANDALKGSTPGPFGLLPGQPRSGGDEGGMIGGFPVPSEVAGKKPFIGGAAQLPTRAAAPGQPFIGGAAQSPAAAGSAAAKAASATAAARPASAQQTQQYGAGQAAGGGFSTSVGSLAASTIGAGMPGGQQAGKLIDRTIGYAGQVAGIVASGVAETFLPGGFGDKLAGFDKSWLGKLAIGLGGAHKASGGGDNRAGQSAPPVDPAAQAARQAAPAIPAGGAPHQGTGAPPGAGGGNAPLVGEMTINQTGQADGDAVARDMNRHIGGAKR